MKVKTETSENWAATLKNCTVKMLDEGEINGELLLANTNYANKQMSELCVLDLTPMFDYLPALRDNQAILDTIIDRLVLTMDFGGHHPNNLNQIICSKEALEAMDVNSKLIPGPTETPQPLFALISIQELIPMQPKGDPNGDLEISTDGAELAPLMPVETSLQI